MVNEFKKDIKKIYNAFNDMSKLIRFNTTKKFNGYHDSVLSHTSRVMFLSLNFASYLKEKHKMNIDMELLMKMAAYHDLAEIKTGDLPAPIKEAHEHVDSLFKEIEQNFLEEYFDSNFIKEIYDENKLEYKIMKLADKYDVYLQMKLIENNYPKTSQDYKNVIQTLNNSVSAIKDMEIYKYFKDKIDLKEKVTRKKTQTMSL